MFFSILGINTFLAIVFMSNSIRSTAPVSKTLRSLDYYMLLCMMFVFGALFEFAVVGITDPDFALSWRKNEEKKSSNKEEPKASVRILLFSILFIIFLLLIKLLKLLFCLRVY